MEGRRQELSVFQNTFSQKSTVSGAIHEDICIRERETGLIVKDEKTFFLVGVIQCSESKFLQDRSSPRGHSQ